LAAFPRWSVGTIKYSYRPDIRDRVTMEKIEAEGYNLNISRYISTAKPEEEIDLGAVNSELVGLERKIVAAESKHNEFLKELGLPLLP
jgi:type I restriction enzyme M protein